MNHKAAVVFLLLVMTASLRIAAGEIDMPIQISPHPAAQRINHLIEARQYKRAIALSLNTAAEMKKSEDWEGYITFMLRAAEIETFEVWKGKGFRDVDLFPDYRRPLKYLHALNQDAGKYLDEYPELKANTLFTNAVVYYWLDMPDTAETLHLEALHLRKNIYGDTSQQVADSYLWMGVLYKWGLERNDLAELHYRKALDGQKRFLPHSRYGLGSVYFGIANIAIENFQFDEAIVLANQYLALYEDLPYEQAFGIQLIANIYWTKGDYEQSLAYRRRTIDIYERSDYRDDLIMEYSNLSTDLLNLGRTSEAEEALQKGLAILHSSEIQNTYYANLLFATAGNLYRNMKHYDTASGYFQQSLELAVSQYGEKNDAVADIYSMRGDMFKDQSRFDSAIGDYQKMLIAVIPGYTATDYRSIPEVQYENPYFKNIIEAAFKKGDALRAWHANGGDIGLLELALDNYRHAYHQIAVARNAIGDELSKPFLLSNFEESIENSIQCASALFHRTNNHQFLEEMFYFVEFTKYLNVLDAIQRAERAGNSEVPVETLLQIQNIRNELNRCQRAEMEHARLALSKDSVARLRDHIVALIGTRKQLMSQIGSRQGNGPANPPLAMISIPGIQHELDDDEQLLEFYWGKDSIYTITLTNETATVTSIPHDSALDQRLRAVRDALEGPLLFGPKDVRHYSQATSRLYEILFRPLVQRRRLIIVPDGPLTIIPVEALVLRHEQDRTSYRALAYAVHELEISYAYSSSIRFHRTRMARKKIEKVLAFSYSGEEEESRQLLPDALPGTFRELESLSQVFGNVSRFTAGDAVKANFIKHAGDHDLIHLGVHGVGDPVMADHSRLVFRRDSVNTEDLYAYEIYNLDIGASLVVLSACETGLGKHQAGEGIFSIARAFTYAGCPSVVMSLWRVHDAHTATLMEEFYKNLYHGRSLSASLRQSKQDFLKHADEFSAHPANWSAFVLNGKNQTFQKSPASFIIWLIGMSVVLLAYLSLRRMTDG